MMESISNGIRLNHLILLIVLFAIVSNISILYNHSLPCDVDRPESFSLMADIETKTERGAPTKAEVVVPFLRGNLQEETESDTSRCRFYLAESALPKAGLGVFTAIDIVKGGETDPMPDICIYIANAPRHTTQIDTHSWQDYRFLGTFDGANPRAICEGVSTLFNSVSDVYTSIPGTVDNFIHTNGGLQRTNHPGAGSITHYFGTKSKAFRNVEAGSEITIIADGEGKPGYPSDDDIKRYAPNRSPAWLRKHGMCIDNIRIQSATDPAMGRGAFAAYTLKEGTIVAPAPLQSFHRSIFAKKEPQEVILNYCFQPKDTNILLFPYGQGVGFINHSSISPNVALRWSTSTMNHGQWLDLSLKEFWKITYSGGLILEVFALRNIVKGEELFFDYGKDWESAWEKHERNWSFIKGAERYVYPADMSLTLPFRTREEQKSKPYPENLMTVCNSANFNRDEYTVMKWEEPRHAGFANVQTCHILQRKYKKLGFEYKVALQFDKSGTFDPSLPYIDTHVPHSAISWVDKPFMSDMYLPNAFRHTIGLPDNLMPTQWMGT